MSKEKLVSVLRERIGPASASLDDEQVLLVTDGTLMRVHAEMSIAADELQRAACNALGIPKWMFYGKKEDGK